jgi:thiamine biosynthesis protein ThiS
MIEIFINGKCRALPSVHTISEVVSALNLVPSMILIEHNGTALRRSEWSSTPVTHHDRLEILQVAAGG